MHGILLQKRKLQFSSDFHAHECAQPKPASLTFSFKQLKSPIKAKLPLQMMRSLSFPLFVVLALVGAALSFQPVARTNRIQLQRVFQQSNSKPKSKSKSSSLNLLTKEKPDVEATTEQFGLEAGLVQAAKEGDGESAKSLLKKYGIAYLATSIPLAIVSFAICYVLVDNGVDVSSLLANVGIETSDAADKAGTFAIAYAAHKAASPIRFPPTVILTPVVAKLIGKEPASESDA